VMFNLSTTFNMTSLVEDMYMYYIGLIRYDYFKQYLDIHGTSVYCKTYCRFNGGNSVPEAKESQKKLETKKSKPLGADGTRLKKTEKKIII